MTLPEELPAFISSFRELFSDPMNKAAIVNGQKKSLVWDLDRPVKGVKMDVVNQR